VALGPKAMGEAIIANLKSKTGKDLGQWQAELARAGIDDPGAARQYLKDHGLGQFQAMTVAENTFERDPYEHESSIVDDQFLRYPDQRGLYDAAVSLLAGDVFTPQPCRGYLPIYRDGKIAVSFKPTNRGLYAALNLSDPATWPQRVDHKPSLGGSSRLKDGVYISSRPELERVLGEIS
jgi:hypothetical protein